MTSNLKVIHNKPTPSPITRQSNQRPTIVLTPHQGHANQIKKILTSLFARKKCKMPMIHMRKRKGFQLKSILIVSLILALISLVLMPSSMSFLTKDPTCLGRHKICSICLITFSPFIHPFIPSKDTNILCPAPMPNKLNIKVNLKIKNKILDTTSPPKMRQITQSKIFDHSPMMF